MQPQFASFMATVAQGFLPTQGMASSVRRDRAGHRDQSRHRHRAEEQRGEAGHADRRAAVRHAGDSFRIAGRNPPGGAGDSGRARVEGGRSHEADDRFQPGDSPRRRSSNAAHQPHAARQHDPRRPDAVHHGSASRPVTRPWRPTKRRRRPNINILEVRTFGSFGRMYLGGEERDIDVGYRAAVAAIEGVTGKSPKQR